MTRGDFYRKIDVLLTNFFQMNVLKANWLSVALLILAVVWLGIYGVYNKDFSLRSVGQTAGDTTANLSAGEIKTLAQCLTDQGFKLYGAFWCGHCKDQKDMFGAAASLLNYVECSTPDGNDQTEVCQQAGIESYPTWEFPDGTKTPGVITLKQLITASGCPIS